MAIAASAGLSLPPGKVFKPSGRQLLALYLGKTAGSGKLSSAIIPGGCSVTAGVDVFAASPNALPFQPSHMGAHGEVWGYFVAAHMADSIQPAPGGCWVRYGEEKRYMVHFQTFGYRRRFAFHVTRVEADGRVMWAPTRWMMKEYRLNEYAMMFRIKKLQRPGANMGFVIRKVFTKPAVPLPLLPSSEAQPTKVPVKTNVVAVRKISTKTMTNTKTARKKVVPPRLPYARPEVGEALQQGGSSLPPRSARPPRPPTLVTKPVAPPPPAKVIATPVAPPNPAQVIAKPVAPPQPPKVIATPVAPLPQPKIIAKPVAPLPQPQAIATPVASTLPPHVIAMPLVSPPPPQVIAKPLILPPPPALSSVARLGLMLKVPSGRHIVAEYLGPKAVDGHLPRDVDPSLVAEGVDIFAVSPDALPFPPSHRKQNGEVWGYFFAAKPTTGAMRQAHGGCWIQYGREKEYRARNGDVVAFHRRFAFLDGTVAWEQARWLMKEYRMSKDTPSLRKVKKGPGSNMDLVVLKVFTKPVVPPRPPPPPPPPAPALFNAARRRTQAPTTPA